MELKLDRQRRLNRLGQVQRMCEAIMGIRNSYYCVPMGYPVTRFQNHSSVRSILNAQCYHICNSSQRILSKGNKRYIGLRCTGGHDCNLEGSIRSSLQRSHQCRPLYEVGSRFEKDHGCRQKTQMYSKQHRRCLPTLSSYLRGYHSRAPGFGHDIEAFKRTPARRSLGF